MVIAAYAGTGKTTFCYENPAAIDLIAMPFKYINLSAKRLTQQHPWRSSEPVHLGFDIEKRLVSSLLLGSEISSSILPGSAHRDSYGWKDTGFPGCR